ncbi:MAG: 50S ribosomal protein L19 [Kiritimatiellia bacterium]
MANSTPETTTVKEKAPAATDTRFEVGDTVKVHLRIKEGEKERIQVFKGTVIARRGRGDTETFTVRRISYGVGIERVFPVHSPHIERIEVESRGRTRRAKLYYLRHVSARRSGLKA